MSAARLSGVLVCGLAIVVAGCGEPPETVVEEIPMAEPVIAPNTISEAEAADGWRLLFDGTSLTGWRGYKMDGVPAGWSVSDGSIYFSPPPEGAEGERADLITEAEFSDFELALEWAISPGGNSGLFFRVSEDQDRAYYTGPEFQILDDAGHRDGQKAETSAGSNYALQAPADYPKRAIGEFNDVRLIVRGSQVEHWLNGVQVVTYELWSDDWKDQVASSKFAQWPAYGMNQSGHIVLQDHGNEVWFRNIRVREL
jgi:hypothetical protein